MSEPIPIVAESLRIHGPFSGHEKEVLIDHWSKLDHRLQSFRDRTIELDLYINERDTPSQHVTLNTKIAGLKTMVAKAANEDLDRALNEVRDETIRQITDLKTRTEPRHNKRLRRTPRRPR